MELIMKITEKTIENANEIESLLGERASAKVLGVSYDTLKKTFRYGGLINYVKYKKGVRYRPSDLRKFIDKHLVVVATD
jgi:predicted site-specific integrase-resolvase